MLVAGCASSRVHSPLSPIRVKVASDFRFVGTQRFVLHNKVDVEQHLFVNDAAGRVVWVQYERYLPEAEGTYQYDAGPTVTLRGVEFLTNIREYLQPPEPGSDRHRAYELLASRGFTLVTPAKRVRLVHVPAGDPRSEVMIVYAERSSDVPESTLLARATAAVDIQRDMHIIPGRFTPGSQPDGNTVILDAPDGWIVIDTGRHAAHTRQILDFARTSRRPIRGVINTHWHLDHIGGNALIRQESPGTKAYASGAIANAMTGFLANYRTQLVEMIATTTDAEQKKSFETEVQLIDSGAALAPDVVIDRSGRRKIAGRELMIGLEKDAVTAGDVWVLDERNGVLIAGDLVTLPAPFLDTACPPRWAESLDRIAQQKFDLLVPGHGVPMTRTQFATYRNAFGSLLKCDGPENECIDAWITAMRPLTPDLDERFTRMLMEYYVGLLRGEAAKGCAGGR